MKIIASLIVVKQSSRLARACLRLSLGPGCLALRHGIALRHVIVSLILRGSQQTESELFVLKNSFIVQFETIPP